MAVALTTIDNPYDPITDFDNWYLYDEQNGYHTSSYLARLIKDSDDVDPAFMEFQKEQAIDEILTMDQSGFYKKVEKDIK